jgi:hypothetical protein
MPCPPAPPAHLPCPAEYGLYGAFVPCIAYALLGSSRQLAVGPVAVTSILLGNGLEGFMTTNDDPNAPTDPQAQMRYNHAAVQVGAVAAHAASTGRAWQWQSIPTVQWVGCCTVAPLCGQSSTCPRFSHLSVCRSLLWQDASTPPWACCAWVSTQPLLCCIHVPACIGMLHAGASHPHLPFFALPPHPTAPNCSALPSCIVSRHALPALCLNTSRSVLAPTCVICFCFWFPAGWVTNFLSHAQVSGFMTGAAILIALSQVGGAAGWDGSPSPAAAA